MAATKETKPAELVKTDPVIKEKVDTLRVMLERSKMQIAKCLPSGMDAERMVRIALTTCQRQPGLLECTPLSVVACTMLASELGLELSGPLGQAYMVPRRNRHNKNQKEATFQVGYRGFYHLAFNSGKVASFPMHAVYSNDDFEISFGTHGHITHRPKVNGPRGEPVGYYCVVNLLPAGQDFEYMSHHEMVEHRKRYASDNNIWDSNFEQMALKTVARRLCKRVPLSTALVKAAMIDEYEEANVRTIPVGERMADATHAKLTALKERLAESGADGVLPEKFDLEFNWETDTASSTSATTTPSSPVTSQPTPESGTESQSATSATAPAGPAGAITPATKDQIEKLFVKSKWSRESFNGFLFDWGTNDVNFLTEAQGQEVCQTMLRALGNSKK